MESFESTKIELNPEDAAEEKLHEILNNPEYLFLTEFPVHRNRIDEAEDSITALAIAEELIEKRLNATFKFKFLGGTGQYEVSSVLAESVKLDIKNMKTNQETIGVGGDAYVVVARSENQDYPDEVCFKFAKNEETPRGRNSSSQEAEIHEDFFNASQEVPDLHIGIPRPLYSVEMGADKIIVMEKLQAKSIDDILRGMGSIPDWLDIEKFAADLKSFLDEMHKQGLYHRDMHVGNIMIKQTPVEPEDGKWGYVIDFGLSGHGTEGMEPYKKTVAGQVFTYMDDYAIIKEVSKALSEHRQRHKEA